MTTANEIPLPSTVSRVWRVGDTVRRETGPWGPAVHALLRHLERAGFQEAPRFFGIDERGREILGFIEGSVFKSAAPVTEAMLASVGSLLARLHEATRGFILPDGVEWAHPTVMERPSVICHNDVSPRNVVFRESEAVGLLDWDFAGPGTPSWDLAHAAWQFVPLGPSSGDDFANRCRRLRLLIDPSQLPDDARQRLIDLVIERMEATLHGIEERAPRQAQYERLVARGIPQRIRDEIAWTRDHAGPLTEALVA